MGTKSSMPSLALLLLVSIYLGSTIVEGQLRTGFYQATCPQAETLVNVVVSNAVRGNRRTGAGLMRLMFHDCFVQGCDASLLLDGTGSEKNAPPNLSVHGYEVIDDAKARVEAACKGQVSCADIVVMAARDSFAALGGGARFPIKTGRKDGPGPSGNTGDIPSPFLDASGLISSFANKGLSTQQMVLLSGAHTVGKAQCGAFTNRLYPTVDPTLDPTFAAELQIRCPNGGDGSVLNDLDRQTSTIFDNRYYGNLVQNKGLLTSDQALLTSTVTSGQVRSLASNPLLIRAQFPGAFNAMAGIGVLTAGPVRSSCRSAVP